MISKLKNIANNNFGKAALMAGALSIPFATANADSTQVQAQPIAMQQQLAMSSSPANDTPTLTQEQVDRLEVGAAAFDYAKANPGHIGVSVLEGTDATDYTGEQISNIFVGAFQKKYGVEASGYFGDNGNKATEVTFHYLMIDNDNKPIVRGLGPYNVTDAASKMHEAINGAKARELYTGIQHGSIGQD